MAGCFYVVQDLPALDATQECTCSVLLWHAFHLPHGTVQHALPHHLGAVLGVTVQFILLVASEDGSHLYSYLYNKPDFFQYAAHPVFGSLACQSQN